jgi:hypothetical protein
VRVIGSGSLETCDAKEICVRGRAEWIVSAGDRVWE